MLLNVEGTVVSTLAGGLGGADGAFADSFGTYAGFRNPAGVAVDASGNAFVGDYMNQRIRKVTVDGGTRMCPFALRDCCADIDVVAPV